MKSVLILATALLAFSSAALGQTLTQTAAFILNAGLVDLGDMKIIDADTIQIPGRIGTMLTLARTSQVWKTIDPRQCIIQETPAPDDPYESLSPNVTYYLNNVVAEDTTIDDSGLHFKGEDFLECSYSTDGIPPTQGKPKNVKRCSRSIDITFQKMDAAKKVVEATKYLYSKFCTSEKRKSAF